MNTHISRQSEWIARIFAILLVASLLAALVPAIALAATKDCDRTFEVRRGDTLAKIGSIFGYSAAQIVDINDLKKPYAIYVGQTLCIPTKSVKVHKVDSSYTNKAAAYFVVGRTADGQLLLVTAGYPKTTVKIKGFNNTAGSRTMYNIGTLNITSSTNGHSYRYKLPSALANAKNLLICLKDQTSNHLQCAAPRAGS
jgi:LysM repeat protein